MNPKLALVVCHKNNYDADSSVMTILSTARIPYRCINREKLNAETIKGADLIIPVGGDGTFLRSCQYVTNQLVWSVSSNLDFNEGFFSRADKSDFEKKLKLLISGNFKLLLLKRLESVLSSSKGKIKLEPALNEIYAGSRKAYLTARYIIEIDGKSEFQKSSGVIVSTAAGSTAWAGSAGVKPLPLTSEKFQYIVREPYLGRLSKPNLKGRVLSPDAIVTIKSLNWDGVVVIDGHHNEHQFNEGSTLTIRQSKLPLRFVSF